MTKADIKSIIAATERVLPVDKGLSPLHEPCFAGNEWGYVKECLDTGWVSSVGKFVDRFEEMLVAFTGAKYAIATVNGTAALHICLKLVGVERGDEVLIPALTFVATANAVAYCDAVPHLLDCEERTLGIDPKKLGIYLKKVAVVRDGACFNQVTGARIRAIVPMHTFGHPVDMDELLAVCEPYRISVVEDAAESLGSYYKGRHTGNLGKVASLSFNGNKVVTTGGGGAILTNDASVAAHAKHLTTTARVKHAWRYEHDEVGYNYRLPNINAALGCAQLEQLPGFLKRKRNLAQQYATAFKGVQGLSFFVEPEFGHSNYWLNAIILEKGSEDLRDGLLEAMQLKGIQARPAWLLMSHLKMYSNCPRMDLSVAESLEQRVINIPSGPKLGREDG